nr:MAG TPA: hypothetical protein [Caudoviricetes sp.]
MSHNPSLIFNLIQRLRTSRRGLSLMLTNPSPHRLL